MRSPGQGAADVRSAFLLFGECCTVVAGSDRLYNARDDLDDFVDHPASAEECDWISHEPGSSADGTRP